MKWEIMMISGLVITLIGFIHMGTLNDPEIVCSYRYLLCEDFPEEYCSCMSAVLYYWLFPSIVIIFTGFTIFVYGWVRVNTSEYEGESIE